MAHVIPGLTSVAAPTEQMREYTADNEETRKMSQSVGHDGILQRKWGLGARLDPTVSFEEYTYWAEVERDMEDTENKRFLESKKHGKLGFLKGILKKDPYNDNKEPISSTTGAVTEKHSSPTNGSEDPIAPVGHDFDADWRQASRALRTASWGGVFYLITTDILGWGQTPYVFSNTGYGLGVGMFVLMGLAAGASGFMIWRAFLKLDSSRYPVMSYGDPFFRLFGKRWGHFINVLQAIQMFLSVAIVQLGQTGIIAQLAGSVNLCFVVCGIISLVVGMISGYMRSLKHVGWFCNASVWINIVTFIIVIAAAASNGPDVAPAVQFGILPKEWLDNPAPVTTFIGTPPNPYQPTDSDYFAANFNGINSIVYAYSGALLFFNFLSEMRHPMDFWKAMLLAQLFIGIVYIIFGAVVYHFYGQYSYVSITQVMLPFGLQTAGNVLGLITGWLAIFLYFNVGFKVVYLEVGQAVFGLPPITTKRGKHLWWVLGPVYWILAFVLAMSVPEFGAFTNFVGGLFSLNFTYSFSGVIYLGIVIQEYARLPGEGFNPATGVTTRHDKGMKRWVRGFMKGWFVSIPVLLYTLASFAASGMGTWAATLALEAAFGPGGSVVTSWTCVNPYFTG